MKVGDKVKYKNFKSYKEDFKEWGAMIWDIDGKDYWPNRSDTTAARTICKKVVFKVVQVSEKNVRLKSTCGYYETNWIREEYLKLCNGNVVGLRKRSKAS